MLDPGDILDGYRIDSVIGRGGMGTVYRATDTALDKTVALKVIAPHLSEDATFRGRFQAEARALARLDAPGIVRVHALRESDGAPVLVMEYVDGPSLDEMLHRRGPLPIVQAVVLLRQLLDAVAHAHASDVLHRDLKPSNVLLAHDGQAKISDFGLAKILSSDNDLTSTYETAGTLAYMSPEQIRSLKHVDARSDLFAIGMMAYEALTGRLPFDRDASAYEVQRAIVEDAFDPPSAHRPDVPDALDAFVMRLLAKAPEDRPDSAAHALAQLDDAVATPTSAQIEVDVPKSGQSVGWWIGLGIGGLLILTATLFGVTKLLQAPVAPRDAPTAGAAGNTAGDTAGDTASLSITSTPPGAAVFVAGDSAGQTPLTDAVAPGSVDVRLELPGRATVDTTLRLEDDADVRVALPDTASSPNPPAPSSEPETSEPQTPQTETSEPETSEPKTPETETPQTETSQPSQPSNPSTAPPSDAPSDRSETGVVSIRAIPFATVTINGTVRARESGEAVTDTLPPGTHRVELAYRGARWAATLQLGAGETISRTVDFTQTVDVAVTAQTSDGQPLPNAAVFVDGAPRGYTPQRLSLRVGQHTIRVERDGFGAVERVVTVDGALTSPLVFEMPPA